MDEIDAMKAISAVIDKLQTEEKARVLVWVQSKFGGAPAASNLGAPTLRAAPMAPAGSSLLPKIKAAKKAKTIISMDKTLNLLPQGKQSAVQFAAAKAPSNAKEKCVVAAYYLRDVIELQNVTAQAVFTFFKGVQWPMPADLKNTLQQAGSSGWLDTADSEDIKITSSGENLVEHHLPHKAKA
ncbi:MAG: hypothetical protein ACOZAA_01260 [Pseudomonadota bacterium]